MTNADSAGGAAGDGGGAGEAAHLGDSLSHTLHDVMMEDEAGSRIIHRLENFFDRSEIKKGMIVTYHRYRALAFHQLEGQRPPPSQHAEASRCHSGLAVLLYPQCLTSVSRVRMDVASNKVPCDLMFRRGEKSQKGVLGISTCNSRNDLWVEMLGMDPLAKSTVWVHCLGLQVSLPNIQMDAKKQKLDGNIQNYIV